MRTTVTFDPDVYARLSRLRQQRELKPFINEVLRLGWKSWNAGTAHLWSIRHCRYFMPSPELLT